MTWFWILGAVLLGLALELLFPLRRRQDSSWPRRIFVNAVVAGSSYWISKWTAASALISISYWAEEHSIGLLPAIARAVHLGDDWPLWFWGVGFLLLDWSVYTWHRMMHTIPLLWRFHRVHHADFDMDSTTALRFHFGEFFFSNLYRVVQIGVIGVPVPLLVVFELAVTFGAIFHHSNFRIPRLLDRFLSSLIATPRIHSIHHSQVSGETQSNYGSLFLFWDRLHRTLNTERLNQIEEIQIGDSEWSNPTLRGVKATLGLPFFRRSL